MKASSKLKRCGFVALHVESCDSCGWADCLVPSPAVWPLFCAEFEPGVAQHPCMCARVFPGPASVGVFVEFTARC
eukprot:4118981-Alexandrium_andersonii.AAC.1